MPQQGHLGPLGEKLNKGSKTQDFCSYQPLRNFHMSFSYTSLVIRPSCWGQGSPLCPCLRPRPPVIVAAQVLKEQKPLSGSGEDHARIGCALFYTDDRQPASDHQSLQNSMTHARSGLSDLLLVLSSPPFLELTDQIQLPEWLLPQHESLSKCITVI